MSDRDWGELRNLAEKATPGGWRVSNEVEVWSDRDASWDAFMVAETVTRLNPAISDQAVADAEFIAAASPGVVKELIEENEKLRETMARINRRYRTQVDTTARFITERDAALAVIEAVRVVLHTECDEKHDMRYRAGYGVAQYRAARLLPAAAVVPKEERDAR